MLGKEGVIVIFQACGGMGIVLGQVRGREANFLQGQYEGFVKKMP